MSKSKFKLLYSFLKCILICFFLCMTNSCTSDTDDSSFESMRTIVKIDSTEIYETTYNVFSNVDALMNEWREGSYLSKVNRMAGVQSVNCPNELCIQMERAIDISKQTQGAFDPSWAAVWELWDFSKSSVPNKDEVQKRLPLIDWSKIEVSGNTIYLQEKGMLVGLGGFAKGVALDLSDRQLQNEGFTDYMIQIGGQIFARGKPRNIGIRKPDGFPGEIIGTVKLINGSISTSGDYEKFFIHDGIRYHHIIDPSTGYPARGLRSVTVLSMNASEGDALSTALFVMGLDRGMSFIESKKDTEALFIDDKGEIFTSTGFNLN